MIASPQIVHEGFAYVLMFYPLKNLHIRVVSYQQFLPLFLFEVFLVLSIQ
ncbi:hypothetical protein BDGGKGIB_03596 [Nodularia sphaerocarpa UHCC 0038]|nr:hypothetical protein BDGGKGIB_03596 [Nodularia sphaerocarpa UHCC 0038]